MPISDEFLEFRFRMNEVYDRFEHSYARSAETSNILNEECSTNRSGTPLQDELGLDTQTEEERNNKIESSSNVSNIMVTESMLEEISNEGIFHIFSHQHFFNLKHICT